MSSEWHFFLRELGRQEALVSTCWNICMPRFSRQAIQSECCRLYRSYDVWCSWPTTYTRSNKNIDTKTNHSLLYLFLHCVSKKVFTYELSVTLSNLNRFWKCLHCWKAHEICYRTHITIPIHLRHVATLPWEIKNSHFLQTFSRYGRKCKQIAF